MYRNYPRFYKKVISANKLIQQNTRYENNTQESATNNEQVQKVFIGVKGLTQKGAEVIDRAMNL